MISRFFLAIQRLNEAAKREGRASTDRSETLQQHIDSSRLERGKYLKAAVPAFIVGLRRALETEISDLNDKLYAHSDLICVSGNEFMLSDILLTSNVENSCTADLSIEITTDLSGEIVQTTRCPRGRASSQKQLFLGGFGEHMRVATETTSYSLAEYTYALIEHFLKARQESRERGD